jgi:uncharacterized tellurite resistance protein B-like protein
MSDTLSREDRMLLVKFVCAFAWADLIVDDRERRFVERLVKRLELDDADLVQAEQWLHVAPSPASVDPAKIPEAHRRVFVDTIRALIYVDGKVDEDERASFERLQSALGVQ